MKEMAAPNVHQTVLDLIRYEKRGKVLDAGCGKGALSKELTKLGFEVVSGDMNSEDFEGDNEFVEMNLNKKFPFNDNEFDYVVCVEVAEHLENTRHLLRGLKRILKPEGKIILTTPNILHAISRWRFLFQGILWGHSSSDYKRSGHINAISYIDFKRICKELNLAIEQLTFNKGLLLPFKIPMPRNLLFGEILILKLRKNS